MEEKDPIPTMFFFFFLSSLCTFAQNTSVPVNVNVGVVLDLGTLGGKIGLSCIDMALSDLYASNSDYKTRLLLSSRDSESDVVGAATAAVDLIQNVQVEAIIGPNSSMQANFVIQLGEKAQVPIISFSASSPLLTSIQNNYFIQATQNDSSQVKAISAILKAFGWREAVPVYEGGEYGEGIIPYLTDALQEVDTRVPYRSVIDPLSTDDQIVEELYKLKTMQTRVFIVHMLPSLGTRLFTKAKEIGMMDLGYVWIVTNGISNELSSLVLDSMQGVLGVKTYVPKTKELENFQVRLKRKFQKDNPNIHEFKLDIYGLWAHDAALALAMAVEKAASTNFSFHKINSVPRSELFAVSQNGPKLLQALSGSDFRGLTGDFHLVNGKLQSSTFQIVNINGNGWKKIGYWTPTGGLSKKLNFTGTGKEKLGPIIWPGDSTSIPKGWEIPTDGKTLRIGVPGQDSFSEFVKVTRDPVTNITSVTGYCIDVFDAVMELLPYSVPYEFIPFVKPNGGRAGFYNDLVYQVFLEKFDAVVGDTSIIANRSQYVDFTLPYTESSVYMIVPIISNKRGKAWVFLKPLTWDLWVISACFFVFIGFIVWILEHRINPDFRGPPSHQVGTSMWFSFSTMVFAQRERVVSNLARFVMIVWCFVVLILIQNYTASLTSLLTVQQLQPTLTDINELIIKRKYIGYQDGSFVLEMLKSLGFHESRIRGYHSPEECYKFLTKGSDNGGIDAAFDEAPYMKLFLAQHCSEFAMLEPTYKTGGFGFVFPKGSPLVGDVSRAILSLTEGGGMSQIEETWLGPNTTCPDPSTLTSSHSLGLESFWGLFLIAGVAASLAMIISAALFLYEHRHIFRRFGDDPDESVWTRIGLLFRNFDKKDLRSHTFRNREMQETNGIQRSHTDSEASPMSSSFRSSHEDEDTQHSAELAHRNRNSQSIPEVVLT